MQVLPDSAPDGARNADVVLEARPREPHRFLNEILHDCAALGPQSPLGVEPMMRRSVSDHEAAESSVADENVRAEPEDEILDAQFPGDGDSMRKVVGGLGLKENVGWSADSEGRVGC